MVDEDILKEVIQVFESNSCPLENIDAETMIENLELDSIGLTKVLMDLEERLSIYVPDQAWGKWQNIGDLIEYISNYQQEFGGLNLKEM